MVTSCVPFSFISNPFIIKAAQAVGVQLPGRKAIATTLLDELFNEIQTFSRDSIADMDYPCGASDGWQKKYCEQGNPLMNFIVVGNEGQTLRACYSSVMHFHLHVIHLSCTSCLS
jgi:hypothetical protein